MNIVIVNLLALILFVIGLYGVMTSKVGIKMLFSIEIMINSAILSLIAVAGVSMQPIVLALFAIAVAVVESAVGISLLVALKRIYGEVNITLLGELRG